VLLVDDNDVSRYILREILDQPWLEIEEASNGATALALVRENPPDALILDLLMPDVSGFEVLRQLRSETRTECMPVLIYTSKLLSDVERMQLESWRARVLRKENVSARLSAQPFLDWLDAAGVSPAVPPREPKI
jgi:CheY-like chemotaxis protein